MGHGEPEVLDDPDSALVSALSKVTGISMPKKKTPKRKKKFVEDSISWLRENDPGRLDTIDDPTAMALTKFAGISYEGRPLSREEKKLKALEDTLTWVRNNEPEVLDDPDSALVSALSKVTGI